jgi:membrane-associated phospholipid phosphatase
MNANKNQSYAYPVKGIKWGVWVFVLLLIVGLPLLFFPKDQPTWWLNAWNTPFLDRFFYYITYLGDGWLFLIVFFVLLLRNYVLSGFFVAFVVLEAVLVQLVLKKGLFDHLQRPAGFIADFELLHQVPGVDLNYLHSFPSGHTQSAFLMAFFLLLLFQNYKSLQLIIPIIAMLVGISRVYLLQHFFIDVWFGAFIGFVLPFVSIYLLQKYNKYPVSEKGLLSTQLKT